MQVYGEPKATGGEDDGVVRCGDDDDDDKEEAVYESPGVDGTLLSIAKWTCLPGIAIKVIRR